MKVRCGACKSEVQIPGPGRFNCPSCGSPNEVRGAPPGAAAGMPPPAAGMPPPAAGSPNGDPPAQPAPPEPPSPKTVCADCGFSFIVGAVEVVVCPNCRAEVRLKAEGEAE